MNTIQQYEWELSNDQIAQRYDVLPQDVIRFDMNTNPYVPSIVLETAAGLAKIAFNEYPAPSYQQLVSMLTDYAGVDPEQIAVGAGGDEIVDVIAKTFVEKSDLSVVSVPTYSMFSICSSLYGANVIEIPREKNYALNIETLVDASRDAKLLWLCNPNSPTGNLSPRKEIEALLRGVGCTVVVDEAYVEFCGQSIVDLIDTYENLVVVRTMSKSFGLAGARVGYAICTAEVAKELNKVRLPSSISSASVALAEAALSERGVAEAKENIGKIIQARGALKEAFEALGLKCFASVTNFLLVDFQNFDAGLVFDRLLSQGLVVRNYSFEKETQNCLRVTVRTPEQNMRLVSEIEKIIGVYRA